MVYRVYQATFPDGSVYVGRTGQTLERRIEAHHRDAAAGGERAMLVALRSFPREQVKWETLWSGTARSQSMAMEIVAIRRLCLTTKLLNRTRGGWYDRYDAGVSRPKRRRRGVEFGLCPKSQSGGGGEPREGGGVQSCGEDN